MIFHITPSTKQILKQEKGMIYFDLAANLEFLYPKAFKWELNVPVGQCTFMYMRLSFAEQMQHIEHYKTQKI